MVLIVKKKIHEYIERYTEMTKTYSNEQAQISSLENAVNILETSLYTKFLFLFTF